MADTDQKTDPRAEYQKALQRCREYQEEHGPIEPGSAEHLEFARLWDKAWRAGKRVQKEGAGK